MTSVRQCTTQAIEPPHALSSTWLHDMSEVATFFCDRFSFGLTNTGRKVLIHIHHEGKGGLEDPVFYKDGVPNAQETRINTNCRLYASLQVL